MPIFQVDEEGVLVSVCEEWRDTCGVALGVSWLEVVEPAERPKIRLAWERANQSLEHFDAVVACLDEGQSARITLRPVTDAIGRVYHFGSLTPRSASVDPEQVFESSGDAILAVNPAGKIELANARAFELFGYSREELLGASIDLLVPEAQRQSHGAQRELFRRKPALRPMGTRPFLAQRKDGELITVEIQLSPLRGGETPIVTAAVRDVGGRQRRQLDMLLRERLATADMLAAAMLHELNNPLTAIVGNLDLSEEAILSGRHASAISSIREARTASLRIRDILRELREFSLAEHPGAVDLHAVIDRTLTIGGAKLSAANYVIRDYGASSPVRGNPVLLAQVVLNLLMNAVDAMAEVPPRARELRVRTYDRGAFVCCEVSDIGRGIPAPLRPHIFDLGYSTKDEHTGVGLALCRQIVERWGGRMKLVSRPEFVTTMLMEIPRHLA